MAWQQIRIRTNDENADALETLCVELGAVAVTFEDAGDQPVLEPRPGEMPLWQDVTLTALFDQELDGDLLSHALQASGVSANAISLARIAERDWQNEWLRDFEARDIGSRLRIIGSHQNESDDDRLRIVLDPGLAFGSGSHATTALALEWLQTLSLAGRRVLDVGCGSGILAIGALRLGAASACGLDIDPQALVASERNATINGVAERLTVYLKDDAPSAVYDIVVANILANTLAEMAPELAARTRPGGQIALTGVLPEQVESLTACYSASFELAAPLERDGWVLLHGVRR